jgi:hypothetical protein
MGVIRCVHLLAQRQQWLVGARDGLYQQEISVSTEGGRMIPE